MKNSVSALLALWVIMLCGCVAGRPYTFSRVEMTVVVIDSITKKPIQGASLRLVARGNHTGKVKVWDGFRTDASGRCAIDTPSQTTWIGLSESFAGGFNRELEVKAPGYETSYPLEELHYVDAQTGYTYPFREPKIHVIQLRLRKEPIQVPEPTSGLAPGRESS